MVRDPFKTRERIDRSAMELFVEKGIDGTSVRDIAAKASIADGALYRHYKSKEDLAWQLFENNAIVLSHILDRVRSKGLTAKEKFQGIIECIAEIFDEDPIFFQYLFLPQHGFEKRFAKKQNLAPLGAIRSMFEILQKDGVIAIEVSLEQETAVFVGIIYQTAMFHLHGYLKGPLKDRVPELTKICWAAFEACSTEGK